jgi:hypothetical protein
MEERMRRGRRLGGKMDLEQFGAFISTIFGQKNNVGTAV